MPLFSIPPAPKPVPYRKPLVPIPATLYLNERGSYRVEYSTSPFYEESQALTVSCESEQEVQVITTNATAVPEVQLVHLKMEDDFATMYPGATAFEVQASLCPL